MNLKANYERMFGPINEDKPPIQNIIVLSENQQADWVSTRARFERQNPGLSLTMKNGNVLMNSRIVESVSKFLDRDVNGKMAILNSIAIKLKV